MEPQIETEEAQRDYCQIVEAAQNLKLLCSVIWHGLPSVLMRVFEPTPHGSDVLFIRYIPP